MIGDPVAAGFIDSLARPGGNATGFMNFEFALSSKWLETIKQIAPSATRVGVLRDPAVGSGTTQFAVIQAAAPSMGVDATPVNMREAGEIAHSIESFAAARNGGLIVTAGAATYRHRDLIIMLAARHKLPAVYYERFLSPTVDWFRMGPVSSISISAQRPMSTAFSRARSLLISLCKRQPSTSWSSISKQLRRSGSTCRPHCSPAPTR